jgi:molybdenum cofactor biosynthesis enzyme MoaA
MSRPAAVPIEETNDVVTAQLRNRLRVLNHRDLVQSFEARLDGDAHAGAEAFPQVALVEVHATDACDLDCVFCTYADRVGEAFPFDELHRVALLRPRAIVLAGGGEPTTYRDKGRDFGAFVRRLAEVVPGTPIGLATNGLFYPGDEAARCLAWARVSLDAATQKVYSLTKRDKRGSFDERIANTMSYLLAGVPHVGVGFIYHKYNLHEVARAASLVFDTVREAAPRHLSRVNMQFRPTCGIQSCECPSDNYSEEKGRLLTPDLTEEWARERAQQTDLIRGRMEREPEFAEFVTNQTNYLTTEVHQPVPKVGEFKHCYLSTIRVLLRADGSMYPCVMKASQRGQSVANLLSDTPERMHAGMRSYYQLDEGWCRGRADCCNIDGPKNIYMQEAAAEVTPIEGPPVDPFF